MPYNVYIVKHRHKGEMMNTRTIRENTQTEFNEVIKEISYTTVSQVFDSLTAYFQVYHEEAFVMPTRLMGRLFDDDNNLRMKIYKFSSNHNGLDRIVIETHDGEAEKEIQSLEWIWHSLICEIS
jgi:NADH:ubiquinone oxidoreductase subunit C